MHISSLSLFSFWLAAARLGVAVQPEDQEINMSEEAVKHKYGPLAKQNLAAASLGAALILNQCDYDVYLWSVDYDHPAPAYTRIPAHSGAYEGFRTPSNGGGVSVKISRSTSNAAGHITQFEYTVANGRLTYDISFVDCAQGTNADSCPAHEHGISMRCGDGSCPVLACAPGAYCPDQAYYNSGAIPGVADPNRTSLSTAVNMAWTLCTDGPALRKRGDHELFGKGIAGRHVAL